MLFVESHSVSLRILSLQADSSSLCNWRTAVVLPAYFFMLFVLSVWTVLRVEEKRERAPHKPLWCSCADGLRGRRASPSPDRLWLVGLKVLYPAVILQVYIQVQYLCICSMGLRTTFSRHFITMGVSATGPKAGSLLTPGHNGGRFFGSIVAIFGMVYADKGRLENLLNTSDSRRLQHCNNFLLNIPFPKLINK